MYPALVPNLCTGMGTHLSSPPSFLHKLSLILTIAQEVFISQTKETMKGDPQIKGQEAVEGPHYCVRSPKGYGIHGPSTLSQESGDDLATPSKGKFRISCSPGPSCYRNLLS